MSGMNLCSHAMSAAQYCRVSNRTTRNARQRRRRHALTPARGIRRYLIRQADRYDIVQQIQDEGADGSRGNLPNRNLAGNGVIRWHCCCGARPVARLTAAVGDLPALRGASQARDHQARARAVGRRMEPVWHPAADSSAKSRRLSTRHCIGSRFLAGREPDRDRTL